MTGVPNRTRKGPTHHAHPRTASRNRRGWKARMIAGSVILALALLAWAIAARHMAPVGNTPLQRFDAIIVLGNPADDDGNPTPTMLSRVTEAVREYERGAAPRLILTGAAVANEHVEAQIMERTAEAQGVPTSSVVVEPNARDTIQNACYAVRIMKAHGWNSAEVISSSSHLPRSGLIFSRLQIAWHSHPAPALQPESAVSEAELSTVETLKTMRYLLWARWREPCEP